MSNNMQTAIGLMSGTSLDGIDAALIRTDGREKVERLGFYTVPYEDETRQALRACLGLKNDPDGRVARAERAMTLAHIAAVQELRRLFPVTVDLIGFHGQTIDHDPARRWTWQIGDAALLAAETGIDVISDFRSADVKAGGQGAPFLPLYHQALAADLEKPLAILNIGGVSNITYIGVDHELLAFDTGPGSALINDWVKQHTGAEFDQDGNLAAAGAVNEAILAQYLGHLYFQQKPPKSLDRNAWTLAPLAGLSLEDGAATLTAFTVGANIKALEHLPAKPKSWHVTGGGRWNKTIMKGLRDGLGVTVGTVDDLGWNGDAMEAEGFAYLAVRSALGLPLSLPGTTNVPEPMTGGRRWSY
ncbi:MAG: anhydro-N-acetylmuramic acid kinase [Micavibrio sp.]